MKKLIAVALLVCMGLVGCGSEQVGISTEPKGLAEQLEIVEGYMKAPDEVYTTLGSENGLMGIKCYVDGAIKEFIPKEVYTVPVCIINSDKGDFAIIKAPYVGDGWDDLSAGENIRVFFQYEGFSQKLEIPIGTFFRAKDEKGTPVGYIEGEESDLIYSAMLDGPADGQQASAPVDAATGGTPQPVGPAETVAETPTPIAPVSTKEPEATQSAGPSITIGQKNALATAESYLSFSAFSYTGLIEQLEYEEYSREEAVYAADNCGADWNEQARKSAESYLSFSSFSRKGLIDQLEYEGFTHEQAIYGVEANGY